VGGSHGRKPESPAEGPLFITKNKNILTTDFVEPTQVFDLMLAHLQQS
jgi:hypothetical protein